MVRNPTLSRGTNQPPPYSNDSGDTSETSTHWHVAYRISKFYRQSFKVYDLQRHTKAIVAALRDLLPGRPLNEWFMKIVGEGTGKKFAMEHNDRWLEETRPILEAFFHARTMLQFIVRYGREFESEPVRLPSGWAAVLYLYDLR